MLEFVKKFFVSKFWIFEILFNLLNKNDDDLSVDWGWYNFQIYKNVQKQLQLQK